MAKKYLSVCPKSTSPFALAKQQSNAASNPDIRQEFPLEFRGKYFPYN